MCICQTFFFSKQISRLEAYKFYVENYQQSIMTMKHLDKKTAWVNFLQVLEEIFQRLDLMVFFFSSRNKEKVQK